GGETYEFVDGFDGEKDMSASVEKDFSVVDLDQVDYDEIPIGRSLLEHPGILISSDVAYKMESPLSLHFRLFAGTNVTDIVVTSGKEAASSTSRKRIIAELKESSGSVLI
ncbi:envelope-like protein, partial [Trifolium medium]|nr:envelope-like protein [Trifolium medium]